MQIDKAMGKGTIIGRLGRGRSSAGDFVFVDGNLYATLNNDATLITRWATMDLSTGKATVISDTTLDGTWALQFETEDSAARRNWGSS